MHIWMEWALSSIALSCVAEAVKRETGFIRCFVVRVIRFPFRFCVCFPFCELINLNFLLHLLDILEYHKGSAHVLVIKYPRRKNDVKGEGACQGRPLSSLLHAHSSWPHSPQDYVHVTSSHTQSGWTLWQH